MKKITLTKNGYSENNLKGIGVQSGKVGERRQKMKNIWFL